ncbi:hypothetical protein PR048_031306 [Dryococelus australis]|uniref:Uncharacterized protein n=1 Tax=Dryococelus australis TaxID=614101 RepID=A0ABQ9G4V4_9NEOP|nr:hypothetical protein PR048_031306 [Dryococelus australis]
MCGSGRENCVEGWNACGAGVEERTVSLIRTALLPLPCCHSPPMLCSIPPVTLLPSRAAITCERCQRYLCSNSIDHITNQRLANRDEWWRPCVNLHGHGLLSADLNFADPNSNIFIILTIHTIETADDWILYLVMQNPLKKVFHCLMQIVDSDGQHNQGNTLCNNQGSFNMLLVSDDEIWAALNIVDGGNRRLPEKTTRPAALSRMILTCENLGATAPEINLGSSRWQQNPLQVCKMEREDFEGTYDREGSITNLEKISSSSTVCGPPGVENQQMVEVPISICQLGLLADVLFPGFVLRTSAGIGAGASRSRHSSRVIILQSLPNFIDPIHVVPDDAAGRQVFLGDLPFDLNHPHRLSRHRCLEPPKSLHSFDLNSSRCTKGCQIIASTVPCTEGCLLTRSLLLLYPSFAISPETMGPRELTEQRRNARAGETGDPRRESPPTSGIVRHDPQMRKSGSDHTGNRTRFVRREASSLAATQTWFQFASKEKHGRGNELQLTNTVGFLNRNIFRRASCYCSRHQSFIARRTKLIIFVQSATLRRAFFFLPFFAFSSPPPPYLGQSPSYRSSVYPSFARRKSSVWEGQAAGLLDSTLVDSSCCGTHSSSPPSRACVELAPSSSAAIVRGKRNGSRIQGCGDGAAASGGVVRNTGQCAAERARVRVARSGRCKLQREEGLGKESATAFVRDPSQHSPEVISGNHGRPEIGMPGPGFETWFSPMASPKFNHCTTAGPSVP